MILLGKNQKYFEFLCINNQFFFYNLTNLTNIQNIENKLIKLVRAEFDEQKNMDHI